MHRINTILSYTKQAAQWIQDTILFTQGISKESHYSQHLTYHRTTLRS